MFVREADKRVGYLFVVFILLPLAFCATAKGSETKISSKTVDSQILILNSYHPGNAWSDQEQAAIVDELQNKGFSKLPIIEYLDYKRLPGGEHLKELQTLFHKKYQGRKLSLLVALDEPAFNFIIKNHIKIFGNAPLVFCGVNNFQKSMLAGDTLATGIVDVPDYAGTIEIMLRLHPQVKEILILHDYTSSGLAICKDVEEAVLPGFARRVRFRFIKNLPVEEIFSELKRLPQDSLVFLLNYTADKDGKVFHVSEVVPLLSKYSKVPIYDRSEQRLGYGIVGGKLVSPKAVGVETAKLVERILNGENVGSIPVAFKDNSRYMFDYRQLERFHIPISLLPPKSIVINQRPISLFAANKEIILTTSAVIVFLILIICLLIVNVVQKRRAVLALRESEAKYYDLYENAPDMYYSVDIRTAIIKECNESFARVTGYAKEELIGRPIFELYYGDSIEEAKKSLYQFDAIGEIRNEERQVKCKDGRIMDVILSVSAIRDKEGNIVNSRSIWRDITKRKSMERELQALSITDTMTGLYNRRGFITLAEQQLKQAERKKEQLMFLFADLDDLKQINDNLGHKAGDEALVDIADVFKEVFRKMDIIARIGGDEFAVLALEASLKYGDIIKKRLQDQLDIHNARKNRNFQISLSIGVAYYDPEHPDSLDELMNKADSLMYAMKMGKNSIRISSKK